MLDFAAAAQVEAIKGRWRIMLDENYANLGTTGTRFLGLVTVDAQPTINVFEFGASYTFVNIANKNATASVRYHQSSLRKFLAVEGSFILDWDFKRITIRHKKAAEI